MLVPALTLVALATAAAPPDTMVYPMAAVEVISTRVPESVLRAPAAISIVGKKSFTDSREISLKDALGGIPGVFVQSRGGAQDVRITIRGFGARGSGERSNSGSMRGLRVMTDGIPITQPDGRTSLDFVDLGGSDKIEVTRSNASAVYGNASGGIINLRTNMAFAQPFIELQERAGAWGYRRDQVVAGSAMGDARLHVSVLNSQFDGWRAHSASYSTQASLRFEAPAGENFRFGFLADAANNLNFFPGALTQAQLDSSRTQANKRFVDYDERSGTKIGRFAATLDGALDAHTHLSVNSFVEPKTLYRSERKKYKDFTRYNLGGSVTATRTMDWSEGVGSKTSIGLDEGYQDGAILFYNVVNGNRGTALAANKREGSSAFGGFAQEELTFGEHWAVRGALRYDALSYIAHDFIDPSLDSTMTLTKWTPKGSISYFTPAHTIYASLGGGVEGPAFNEIDPPVPFDMSTALNPFLKPMTSRTYEVGVKGEVSGGVGDAHHVRYDVALYQIDVTNDIIPYNGGSYFFTAGESRRRGAELGIDWMPVPRVSISGSIAGTDNKYLTYTNDLGTYDDNDIAGLPSINAGLKARYASTLGVSLEAGLEHVGMYYADDANSAEAPAYTLVNATLGYSVPGTADKFRAFVSGNNLFDTLYVSSVFINGTSGQFYEPGLPRNLAAGVTLRIQ